MWLLEVHAVSRFRGYQMSEFQALLLSHHVAISNIKSARRDKHSENEISTVRNPRIVIKWNRMTAGFYLGRSCIYDALRNDAAAF